MSARRLTILGATGSIGTSAADVIRADPERFEIHAVTALANAPKLAERARVLGARRAVVADDAQGPTLEAMLAGSGIRADAGEAALQDAAGEKVDLTLSAIVGAAGLRATAAAVRAGNDVALANKECLVCAGAAFVQLAREADVRLLPVDSEHNALFQLLEGRDPGTVQSVTITASGGPFRTWPAEQLARATPAEALAHPTWSMGDKITIDSATLMNKGLELIEARHLFGLEPDRLRVLVHPQSMVHAMVTFVDGSIHAELGPADMRRPIAHCLYWPERPARTWGSLDLAALGQLTFEEPDLDRFPALALAREALVRGAGAPTVLNAANEVAVAAFLQSRIGFADIPPLVARALDRADRAGLLIEPATIEAALELDQEARQIAARGLQVGVAAAN
jgi:1-deoxy-D-xylulose-5-phosphate reductoisomerase